MEKELPDYCGCLYYSVNALSRILTRKADEAFAKTGLSSSYAFLLMTVNHKPGINRKLISQIMHVTPSTVTRLIEKMEFRGYLERKQCGRCTEVFPTQASLDLDPTIRKAWIELFEDYSETLGKKAAKDLTQAITRATQDLEADNNLNCT